MGLEESKEVDSGNTDTLPIRVKRKKGSKPQTQPDDVLEVSRLLTPGSFVPLEHYVSLCC